MIEDETILECKLNKKKMSYKPYDLPEPFYVRVRGKNCQLLERRNRYGYEDYLVTNWVLDTKTILECYNLKRAPLLETSGA